jgi:hypothetical protein
MYYGSCFVAEGSDMNSRAKDGMIIENSHAVAKKETETQHLITSYLIHLVVCLTIDPTPLPNRAVCIV